MTGRVLIVDDEPNIRKTIEMIHRNAGWEAESAPGGNEGIAMLEEGAFDLVYLDLGMPDRDGMDVLGEIRDKWPQQIVVILTGQGTIERAVEATKLGAFDFLEKDCGKDRILLTTQQAVEFSNLATENKQLKQRVSGGRALLGNSGGIQEILQQVAKVAPTNARVLILGESGTGKELIAQEIHNRSKRSNRPFIKVNCAAIPEELIEAELFGSEKGAYTGSTQSRVGKFQAADGGTLFLDEVGDMSLRVQTKVLRALQEGEIARVGSEKVINVDVRVLAATNKNLPEEAAAGRFREDLYYRLNVVPITASPLRERKEDIGLLGDAFLKEYCDEYGIPAKKLDPRVIELLESYPWPGNVRELRNQVERMVIMSSDRTVRVDDLSAEVRRGQSALTGSSGSTGSRPGGSTSGAVAGEGNAGGGVMPNVEGMPLQDAKREFERALILTALERNKWNVSRAAAELGLERTNLHKKIKVLGLTKETQ